MLDDYFFEIPIYRIDPGKYDIEVNNWKESQIKMFSGDNEITPYLYQNYIYHLEKKITQWRYNEIIGWICIYSMGNQYRGESYIINCKKIRRGIVKKVFQYNGKEFELSIDNESSEQIFELLLNCLEKLYKNKRRYVDLAAFKIIGKFVDWRKLLIEKNIFIREKLDGKNSIKI
jgi:hypothetical protein